MLLSVNEHNAKMGIGLRNTHCRICWLPSQFSLQQPAIRAKPSATVRFSTGALSLVIANNASISGAEGGCSSRSVLLSAMSAAALTLAAGGTPYQASQAVCFVIKNMFLVSFRSSSRTRWKFHVSNGNAMGASYVIAADSGLAGIESPVDEVIDAMYQVDLVFRLP